MNNKFNIKRYRELLKKRKSALEEKDAFSFNDPYYLELLSCEATVYTELYFNHKSNYFSLIEEYLNTTIPTNIFVAEFLDMVKQDNEKAEKILQDFKQLSNFPIDVTLDKFSSLFERISDKCSYVLEFGHEDDGNGISEDEFRNSIEETYFQLKKYLNEER